MMIDYESNMIKPVDGLKDITGMAPARRREERKRRQKFSGKDEEKNEKNFDKTKEENRQDGISKKRTKKDFGPDDSRIDYCA